MIEPDGIGHDTKPAIRLGLPTDALAIRDLIRKAYAKWVPMIGREPWPMTADYADALLRHRFDLIHADGVLAAVIETVVEPDCLLIENVAVSPHFQGRGLGRILLAHVERLAATSSLGAVRLYTNALFTQNIRLYMKLGYRLDREEAFSGGTMVHMSKALPGGAPPG